MIRFLGMLVYLTAIHVAYAFGWLLSQQGGDPWYAFMLGGALVATCYNSGTERDRP